MKTASEDLSARESLEIITEMIGKAKGNVQRQSFYFLLWGWVVALANLGIFVLARTGFPRPYMVWLITIPAFFLSLYYGYANRRRSGTVTHFNHIALWLWVCFAITVFVLVLFGHTIGYNLNPVIITLSAIPTLVSGIVIKFRPLILGGICFWVFGMVCFAVSAEWQNLIGAGAVVTGYLVPGYMLKSKR